MIENCGNHSIGAKQNVVVPKPQDDETSGLEFSRSLRVFDHRFGMTTPVDFYDQFRVAANEVHDPVCDRNLSAKLEAIELATAQARPQFGFGVCGVPSHRLCEFDSRCHQSGGLSYPVQPLIRR